MRLLGLFDQLVDWYRTRWLSAEEYATLPRLLRVRKLEYRVNRSGFRVRR
ncbi:MAG: hypothetical protein MUF18_16905 [Fimbriiglobus sp.]|nr:hypothetical protein [Fimbriiglobus sp.]